MPRVRRPWWLLLLGVFACDSVIGVDDFAPAPSVTSNGGSVPTDSDTYAGNGGIGVGGGEGGGEGGGSSTTTLAWYRTYGSDSTDRIHGLAVRADRHSVLLAGEMGGDLVVGAEPLPSHGGQDVLVAELDADGVPTWSRALGGAGNEVAEDIAIDTQGRITIAGSYDGSPDLGTGALPAAAHPSILLVGIDGSTGAPVWAAGMGSSGETQRAVGVAAAPGGDVVVAGYGEGTVTLGAVSAECGTDGPRALIARVDSTGGPLWTVCTQGSGEHVALDVATDATGSALVGGRFVGTLSFDGSEVSSSTMTGFALELDTMGTVSSLRAFPSSNASAVTAVAVSSTGDWLLAGGFYGAIDLGGDPLGQAETAGMFLGALDPSGEHRWSRWWRAGTKTVPVAPRCIAEGPSGQMLVAGEFTAGADFGAGVVESAGNADGFALRLEADGELAWARTVGRDEQDALVGCGFDAGDAAFAGGFFGGTIQIEGDVLSSGGSADTLLLKLAPP